jgi:hypothetical protein
LAAARLSASGSSRNAATARSLRSKSRVEQELQHLALGVGFAEPAVEAGRGRRDQFGEIELQLPFEHDAQHAERGTAQAVGIAVAGGALADAEDADQQVEFVGQRDGAPGRRRRQRVTGEAGSVLLLERDGDRLGQAVVERVVAAHGPLQFRELTDHVGQQVALGQAPG